MKIAMIGQKGIPTMWGGIERHVEELSKVLAENGHEILVYARRWYVGSEPKYLPENIKVVFTPTIHTKHLDALVHTFTSTIHALTQKPDVIHYHGVGPSLLSFIPRIFSPKTKVVVTFHCIDRYHKKWGWFARLSLHLGEWAACTFPNVTVSVSKTIRDYCLNEYDRETTYIPNGVEVKKPGEEKLLNKLDLSKDKYILMVSRLVPHKGAHYLLAAYNLAKKMEPELMSDIKVVVVGSSSFTDAYQNSLKSVVKNNNVIFTGWLQGKVLESLFTYAALQVHPSENEGMPITVLEGMAHGRAVLLSDIAEHKELIDEPAEFFVNTDAKSLATQMVALLKNPEQRKCFGLANQKKVQANFSWKNIGKDTMQIYGSGRPISKSVTQPNPRIVDKSLTFKI